MDSKHQTGTFQSKDGTKIFYQAWVPESPKGVVIIVHGILEHSDRYQNVVNTLVPEGYAVWAFDHRGHGRSEGRRAYVDRFEDFLVDLEAFEAKVRAENPDLGIHLLGHSMGSLIVAHYVASLETPEKFKSLILSGTGAAPGPDITWFIKNVSKLLSVILPKIRLPAGTDPNFISNDPEVVRAYIEDPMIEMKVTPRIAAEVMKASTKMIEIAPGITIPTLMQIGSEDRAFHPSTWEPLFNAIGASDKEFKLYDGFKHEVYNEVNKEIALNDLKDWINSHN